MGKRENMGNGMDEVGDCIEDKNKKDNKDKDEEEAGDDLRNKDEDRGGAGSDDENNPRVEEGIGMPRGGAFPLPVATISLQRMGSSGNRGIS